MQVCFVLQSTHRVLSEKIQKEKSIWQPPNDRREGGAAWLSSPWLSLQLAIWKDNSLLTSEMHLLARLLRNIKHYFTNPEINFNLAGFNKVRRAAKSFQAITVFPLTGRGWNNRLHLPAQQCQNTLFPPFREQRTQWSSALKNTSQSQYLHRCVECSCRLRRSTRSWLGYTARRY